MINIFHIKHTIFYLKRVIFYMIFVFFYILVVLKQNNQKPLKNNPMIFFNFARFFKLKGIVRPFTYLTKNGYSPGYATKLANNRVNEINLERLEKFCRDFNCTPNDILDFRPKTNDILPKDHALHTLTKAEISNEVIGKINAMSAEKIQQIHNIIKNME